MSDLPPLPPPPQASSAAPETLAEIVELARRQNYSDIHLGVGEQPRFRERGEIISSGWPVTESRITELPSCMLKKQPADRGGPGRPKLPPWKRRWGRWTAEGC